MRAGLAHFFGGHHDLALGFDRAGPGHHDEFVASNFKTIDAHLRALLLEFLADELVRCRDAHRALHSGSGFERLEAVRHVANADHADDHAFFALNGVNLIPELTNSLADVVNLFTRRMGAHRNNHGRKPPGK